MVKMGYIGQDEDHLESPGTPSCDSLQTSNPMQSSGVTPPPRKTRFRLLAELCRAGFVNPQGCYERFPSSSLFPLSRACLTLLTVILDGAEGDGSLEAVGGTYGVSPYWYYGGPSCVLFYRSGRESRYPGAESRRKPLLPSCVSFPFVAHQLASARKF